MGKGEGGRQDGEGGTGKEGKGKEKVEGRKGGKGKGKGKEEHDSGCFLRERGKESRRVHVHFVPKILFLLFEDLLVRTFINLLF